MPRLLLRTEELERRDVPATDFRTLPILPTADPAALDVVRTIAARGRELGLRPDVFVRVGDSNTADPAFLDPLAAGYDPVASGLAAFGANLVQTLNTFQAAVVPGQPYSSFNAPHPSVRGSLYTVESIPLTAGALDASRAGIALVMIGTVDADLLRNPAQFRTTYAALVDEITTRGVVPVLSTVPDSYREGGIHRNDVVAFNQVIADFATERHLPLWNVYRQVTSLPGSGLVADQLHLNHSPNGGGSFRPGDLGFAQNVRNLQALQILDWYRTRVLGPPEAVAPLPGWTPLPAASAVYAVGRDAAQSPVVEVFDTAGKLLNRVLAYDPVFTGGVRVATADVNGDGFTDVVCGAGAGGGPDVRVISGKDGTILGGWFAYEPGFRGGVNVAAADLDGDGRAEVVVGSGDGGGPVVAVFHGGDFKEVSRFYAYDAGFRGGVNVAAGHFAGFGAAVVAGSGVGGGPAVGVFDPFSGKSFGAFYAYDSALRGGVNVAAGDLTGDGVDELITAPVAGAPHVRVLGGVTLTPLEEFFAGDPTATHGLRLAVRGGAIFTGNVTGDTTAVIAYAGLGGKPLLFPPDTRDRAYGIFVG